MGLWQSMERENSVSYKAERYELAGCVRLSQETSNRMVRLGILRSYAALHPSSPPEFAYDRRLYEGIGTTLGKIVSQVPFYHLVLFAG